MATVKFFQHVFARIYAKTPAAEGQNEHPRGPNRVNYIIADGGGSFGRRMFSVESFKWEFISAFLLKSEGGTKPELLCFISIIQNNL